MNICLASGNLHKKAEIQAILPGHAILMPADAGAENFDPEETGAAFADNALIKARALYELIGGRPPRMSFDAIVADDSGLCVDALGGRPGIMSARYGSVVSPGAPHGKKLAAAERNALLLAEVNAALAGQAGDGARRTCRFVCAMVLLFSPERFYLVQETCEGRLVGDISRAAGSGGFGYDPIVFLPEFSRTVAELSEEEKNLVSHRGKAGRAIAKLLD